ncbi:MAG: zf-HC2 domain-containing protein [Ruminococcus sp.]|nr:zf-HC2 domain-containing protein [Ruminococcus sp.]
MKYDCELIQDIMPLYIDDVLRNKSKEIVEEHLSECTQCQKIYTSCANEKQSPPAETVSNESIRVKSYSKRIRNRRIAIFSAVLAVFLVFTASFASYVKFSTPNFFASGRGLMQIMASDTPYVEIQSSPRVIIAQPQNSWDLFLEFVESEGYTFLDEEQMGANCVIEKDGKKEHVWFSVNGYYSKWSWEQ